MLPLQCEDGHVSVSSVDYLWWNSWRPEWAQAYCVTLVSDTTAEVMLTELNATDTGGATGSDEFYVRTSRTSTQCTASPGGAAASWS